MMRRKTKNLASFDMILGLHYHELITFIFQVKLNIRSMLQRTIKAIFQMIGESRFFEITNK